MALSEQIRLLVLYAHYTTRLSYNDDWLDSFSQSPLFKASTLNIVKATSVEVAQVLRKVDGAVLLHSTNGDTTIYLEPFAEVLAARNVPLLSFVGNEVNIPGSPIAGKRHVLKAIAPDWIATQHLQEAGEFLFGDLPKRGVVAIPHALNPQMFQPRRALNDRPIDVGARSARYTPHLGDNDRNRIQDFFQELGRQGRADVDIGNERFTRKAWAEFLNRCKATASSEAGSWFIERDDATVNAIRDYILKQAGGIVIANDSKLRRLGHKLPWPVRAGLRKLLRHGPLRHEMLLNEQADFNEIYERFFKDRVRPTVYGKCISSRHFDAAGTKTLQILFPGRYNDILAAGKHYFPLSPDFSNVDEALDTLHDLKKRSAIAEEAHALMHGHHTYAHRMRQVHRLFATTA